MRFKESRSLWGMGLAFTPEEFEMHHLLERLCDRKNYDLYMIFLLARAARRDEFPLTWPQPRPESFFNCRLRRISQKEGLVPCEKSWGMAIPSNQNQCSNYEAQQLHEEISSC